MNQGIIIQTGDLIDQVQREILEDIEIALGEKSNELRLDVLRKKVKRHMQNMRRELEKGGLVLGVQRQTEYEIETVELREGDCLLFYTDGLIDAADFDGEFWGLENMLEAAKKYNDGSAEQMIKNILGHRRRFVGLASQCDDTSIIIVKVVKK